MKRIIFLIVSMVMLSVVAYAQSCSICDTVRTMTTDPAVLSVHPDPCYTGTRINTFDWYGVIPNSTQSFYINKTGFNTCATSVGSGTQPKIQSPFYEIDDVLDGHLYTSDDAGIVHAHNLPQDGWELMKRDFGYFWNNDGNYTDAAVPLGTGNKSIAYLMLYNKYTSALRVIGSITNTSINAFVGGDIQVSLTFKNTDPWKPSALFNHYSVDGFGKMTSQSIDMPTTASEVTVPAHWGGNCSWFFADFMVAYDPCTCHNPSALVASFKGVATGEIKMQGKFYGTAQTITSADPGRNAEDNAAVEWLASINMPYTGSSSQPLAGMQTYGYSQALLNDYSTQVGEAENPENGTAVDLVKDVFSLLEIAATVAARTEDNGEEGSDGNEKGPNYVEALGSMKDYAEFFSAGSETESAPIQPWIIQGEMALSGTVTFTNELTPSGFEIITPGSKDSDKLNADGTSYYPEFSYAAPVGSNASPTPNLPAFTHYNLPLGNFALLTQPVVHHNVIYPNLSYPSYFPNTAPGNWTYKGIADVYHLDASSIQYVFNPAAPIDAAKSSIVASLIVNVDFPLQKPGIYTSSPDNGADHTYCPSYFGLTRNDITYPTIGFNETLRPLDANGIHYQLSTNVLPVGDLGSLVSSFARPTQMYIPGAYCNTNQSNILDPKLDRNNGGNIKGVYVKLFISLVFKPDPLYPNAAPKTRVMIATYPVKILEDANLTLSGKIQPLGCSADQEIPAKEFAKNTYIVGGPFLIDGNQTIDPGYTTYYYSCGDVKVQNEVTFTGEFKLVSGYNTQSGISIGDAITHPSYYSSISCNNTNHYLANTVSTARAVTGQTTNTYTSFAPEAQPNYLSVAPNPASSFVTLSTKLSEQVDTKLYLTDLSGNVVKTVFEGISSESEVRKDILDVSQLAPGIYLCVLDMKGYKEIKKLVVIN